MRTCARRADPRGQRRGVRRAARQADASRSVPLAETRRGVRKGWASRAGGERNGVSGQRAEESRSPQAGKQTHHHPDLGGKPSRTRAHLPSNRPRLTINSHVSLTRHFSHYITYSAFGSPQGDVQIDGEPHQLHGRPTSGIQTSNQPHLTINSHASLTRHFSHYIT